MSAHRRSGGLVEIIQTPEEAKIDLLWNRLPKLLEGLEGRVKALEAKAGLPVGNEVSEGLSAIRKALKDVEEANRKIPRKSTPKE